MESCSDIGNRFLNHVIGETTSTKLLRLLVLLYLQKFETKAEALAFE